MDAGPLPVRLARHQIVPGASKLGVRARARQRQRKPDMLWDVSVDAEEASRRAWMETRRARPLPFPQSLTDVTRWVLQEQVLLGGLRELGARDGKGARVWGLVAALAAVLSAIQLIPQAWNAIRARDLASISLPSFLLISLTTCLWAAYGIHLGDLAIIFANGIGFVCAATVSLMKLKKG